MAVASNEIFSSWNTARNLKPVAWLKMKKYLVTDTWLAGLTYSSETMCQWLFKYRNDIQASLYSLAIEAG